MSDIVDRETRSRMMAGIRGKHTRPERIVRSFLHRNGFRFRLHGRHLPGHPDVILRQYSTVIFVHGCFWHHHAGCRFAYMPKSNKAFWRVKLAGNAARDARHARDLRKLGWRVVTIWECELHEERLRRLARDLRRRPTR